MTIFTQTLPPATAEVVEMIKNMHSIDSFYLSGGTALSLQLGHRESEDLDFFTQTDFDVLTLEAELSAIAPLKSVQIDKGTLNVFMNGVQLQFLLYQYPLLEDLVLWNNLHLSSVVDIACTKLITISSRGSKKDFIDLNEIMAHFTLEEIFYKLKIKYTGTQFDRAHILKSLIYFDDADRQPMPRMHKETDWEGIKRTLTERVKAYNFNLS